MDLIMRFFTSDTHFGHLRINELADRPFSSVEEMNETMIERWNKVVSTKDTVYHLGDVALGKLAESLPLISRLNGYKILVPGNHDRIFSGSKGDYRERFWPVYSRVFSMIWPEQVRFLMRSGRVVILCHFPGQDYSNEHDSRYLDLRPSTEEFPVIHGHTHSHEKVSGPRSFHVGVDAHDFTPVPEEEIEAWLTTL